MTSTSAYIRTPSIHGDQVIFGSEGEIWQVALSGGLATRLTDTGGGAGNPHFSPDGSQLCFSSQHEAIWKPCYAGHRRSADPR